MPRRAAGPFAVAPAKDSAASRIVWSEPEPWIVAVLLVTGVAVIARHPLARAIGTEASDPTLTPSVVAAAAPARATTLTPSLAAVAPAPTHAPRDPFHSLVTASGAVVAPAAPGIVGAVTQPQTPDVPARPVATGSAAATCTGTMHTVVAGDSLWTIAARAVKSNDTARVTVAWHRIYKANQPPLGSNPSLVPVGAKLCIPASV